MGRPILGFRSFDVVLSYCPGWSRSTLLAESQCSSVSHQHHETISRGHSSIMLVEKYPDQVLVLRKSRRRPLFHGIKNRIAAFAPKSSMLHTSPGPPPPEGVCWGAGIKVVCIFNLLPLSSIHPHTCLQIMWNHKSSIDLANVTACLSAFLMMDQYDVSRSSGGTIPTFFELLEDILSVASPWQHPDIDVAFQLGVLPSHFTILSSRNTDILWFPAQHLIAYEPRLRLLPSPPGQ